MKVLHWLTILFTATLTAAYASDSAGPARALAATGPVTVQKGIAYGKTRGGKVLRLDLDSPGGESNGTAVIWLHGTRPSSPRSRIGYYAEHFATLGYVSATIDYTDDSAHDAGTAVRYFRRHADELGISADRVFIGGYSYGAIVSVGLGELATGASRPDGVISISGYSKRMAPSRSSSPLVMLHGDRDPNVPYSLATRTCAAWKRVSASCRLVTLKGATHSQVTWTRRGQIWPAVDGWLRSRPGGGAVGGGSPAPVPGGGTTAPPVGD